MILAAPCSLAAQASPVIEPRGKSEKREKREKREPEWEREGLEERP